MSDPSSRSADGQSFWSTVRDLLHLGNRNSLRESIEEAIEGHEEVGADPDDLDRDERDMLRNMLHLSGLKAGAVAVPRSAIIALDEQLSLAAIVEAFREAGHSRLPVYRGSLDQVVGMLHMKDIYAVLADSLRSGEPLPDRAAPELLRPVLFVPPSMPVIDLLTDMRRRRTHMALIVDEFGGTDGLVTIEDVVEEIVGDIEDEHDEEETALVVPLGDGGFEADARVELDDLAASAGLAFASPDLRDEVDTLGGLVVLMAGRVPAAGERLDHPNGWSIEVLAGDERRVERLLLRPPAAADGEAPSAGK